MLASILGWILFGLIVGLVARVIHPGPDPMSWAMTIVLGILGALLGGAIAYLLHFGTRPYQPAGWIFAILGAIVLLVLGFTASQPRVTT